MKQSRMIYKSEIFAYEEEKKVPFSLMTFSKHNAYEIYLLLEGERRLYIENKVYDVVVGDAMMLRPNVRHRSEGNTPYKGICFQFTEEQLNPYYTSWAKKKMLSCFEQDIISLDRNVLPEVKWVLSHMMEETENKALYLSMVLALFQNAVRESGSENKLKSLDIRSIKEYLKENAFQITGLEEIATHLGITKEYLCTLFKKQTGTTVVTYLNKIRVEKACRLLETTDESVEQISVICGFQSLAYFHRLFKEMMNCTPAKYRKVMQENRREVSQL